ncbi:MAG: hypothetical protein ABIH65_03745 [Nanoarchaeota archaeon]
MDTSINLITGEGYNDREKEKCLKLSWLVFLEDTNTHQSQKKLNPKSTSPTDELINKCFQEWKTTEPEFLNTIHKFIKKPIKESKGIGKKLKFKYSPTTTYIFNLNPLFVYINRCLSPNEKLTDTEKNFLRALFDVNSMIEKDNLIVRKFLYHKYKKRKSFVEAIPHFYYRYFYQRYLEEESGLRKKTEYDKDILEIIKMRIHSIINSPIPNITIQKREKDIEEENDLRKLTTPTKRWTKADEILEKYLEKLQKYEKNLEFNNDFYYSHYLALHKYFPDIAKNLDLKIKRVNA